MAPLAPRVLLPLLAACCAPFARGDLPVHCVRHQLMGEWEFTLGPPSAKRSSCGHLRPDRDESQPKLVVQDGASSKKVKLSDPNVASTDSDPSGTWTMVYDEGFEMRVDGLQLFAFSKFDLWNAGGQKHNVSHCGATQLGWYQDKDRTKFGCYYGKMTSGPSVEAASPETPAATAPSFLQTQAFSASYDMALSREEHQRVADQLNGQKRGWMAQVYDRMVGRTRRELNGMSGILRPMRASHVLEEAPVFLETHSQLRTRAGSMARLRSMDEELGVPDKPKGPAPRSLNWAQAANNQSFLEPVIDQGDCGSCYTVATMRMLSARNKIAHKDTTLLPFSISFPLYCAEYNQGCDGGYAFLATKWSADVGMVPATCFSYQTTGSCKVEPSCLSDMGQRFRASNHRYVGGYYGGASEETMMAELYQNGPLVVSLEPKDDLMYYKGGVYKSGPDQHPIEWERVDHAVLLIGFGEEGGQKYWTLQNSWGDDWGEDGFFRFARGINDSGIESIAVAADVIEDDQPEILTQFLEAQATL